jgi:hypothetical protein
MFVIEVMITRIVLYTADLTEVPHEAAEGAITNEDHI